MNLVALLIFIAQSAPSSSGLEFMRMNVGGRAFALGGAYTALADEPFGIFYNPGGVYSELPYLSSFYGRWFMETHLGSIAGIYPFGKTNAIGFGLRGLFSNKIELRDEENPFNYSYYNTYFLNPVIVYIQKFNNLRFGLGLNGINTKIETATGNGVFLSAGLKYATRYIDCGMSFTNLGTKVLNTDLPISSRLGLCFKPVKNLNFSLDLLKPLRDDLSYYWGIEYQPVEVFSMRLGYNNDVYSENFYKKLSLGIGLKMGNIVIDYAAAPCGIFGWTHFLTLSYRIRPEATKPEEFFAKEKMMSETYLNQGIEYYNLGKLEEALNSFDLSLIWLPDNKVAIDWIEKVQNEKKIKSIEVFLNDGKNEMGRGNYLGALYNFQHALELDSTRADIRELKIECERKMKEGTTRNVKEMIEQGLAKFNAGEYLKAVQLWNEALKLEPANPAIKNYIAEANQKMIDEITESLKKINTYINQGNFKKAQDLVKYMLKKYPNQENLSKQKIFIDQRITERVNEHLSKGRELFNVQKYGDAEKEFQKVLEYEPKNIQALSYLDKIRKQTKPGKKEDVDRYYLLGIDAYTKNNFELAIDYWNKVLEIDPHYPNVKKNLERARIKLAELNK